MLQKANKRRTTEHSIISFLKRYKKEKSLDIYDSKNTPFPRIRQSEERKTLIFVWKKNNLKKKHKTHSQKLFEKKKEKKKVLVEVKGSKFVQFF